MIDLERLRDQAEYDVKRGREWSTTSCDVLMLLDHIAKLEEKLKNKEAVQAQRTPLDAYKLREIIKRLSDNHDEDGWNFGDLAREVEAYHGITQEKQGMKCRITRICKYTETIEVEADSAAQAWEQSQGADFAHSNDDTIEDEKIEAIE